MRIALATLAAALLLAAPAAAQTDTTPTIAADGLGTATLVPDLADFSAGVLRRAPTSAAARRAANSRIAAILKAVKAGGVADADIQTTGLRISGVRTVDVDPQTEPEFSSDNSGASGGSAKSPSTQVEPGTQDFEARVRVIYTATPAT